MLIKNADSEMLILIRDFKKHYTICQQYGWKKNRIVKESKIHNLALTLIMNDSKEFSITASLKAKMQHFCKITSSIINTSDLEDEEKLSDKELEEEMERLGLIEKKNHIFENLIKNPKPALPELKPKETSFPMPAVSRTNEVRSINTPESLIGKTVGDPLSIEELDYFYRTNIHINLY